jgi:AcrR family transcriptional regulator
MPAAADLSPAEAPALPAKKIKDRAATERAILLAAKKLLADKGFQGFGINAIARGAGCDKQLIYRYYGGLSGLIDAIGVDLGSWVDDSIPEDTGGMFMLTYGDLIERLALYYLEALRRDPLVCKVVAWEVSQDTPQVRQLAEARAKSLAKWLDRMRGSLAPPKGVDTSFVNALIFGAIQHLVIASAANGQFSGIALKSEKDWEKAIAAVKRLVRSVYG